MKVTVITTSRADFGHIVWPVKAMQSHDDIDVDVIAMGAHLSPSYGHTLNDMASHGIEPDHVLETLISSDTDVGMAKTIGVSMLSLSDCLAASRPDVLLVTADRYEMLAAASVALALRIPIAHVEGGEVSAGAIDDAVRNALTKLSHLHFAPHTDAAQRIMAMGEEPWRVCVTGAPSLDHLRHRTLLTQAELERALQTSLDKPFTVVSYHPVTLLDDTVAEADAFYDALHELDQTLIFCFPNCDAGSHQLVERANQYCETHLDSRVYVNLDHWVYWSLLHQAHVMIGNSSSALMEAPSIPLPVVNVGERQRGRLTAPNVVSCAAESSAIVTAWRQAASNAFRRSLDGMQNPYGDGQAATRMCQFLLDHRDRDALLDKRARTVVSSDQIDGFLKTFD
ncbi:MAG: UDP-N-acetylglucosamine 2-epimerase [Pseudomonadota bacterium]